MIITTPGIYAILNDSTDRTFKEWRYLVEGTICDNNLVLPQTLNSKPQYNIKTQKLIEVITVREKDVLQDWIVKDLTIEEINNIKRPNGNAFQLEMIQNSNLLPIYQKILSNNPSQVWLNEVRAALLIYTVDGFSFAINKLAMSVPLNKIEIDLVNEALYKYDLELITWRPE